MTSSFALVCSRWGWPLRSSLSDGKVYMPAPPLSSSWIGRLIGGSSGSVADRLGAGPARANRTGSALRRGLGSVRARPRRRESDRCPHRRRRGPRRDWPSPRDRVVRSPRGSVPMLGGPAEQAASRSEPGCRSRRGRTAAARRRPRTDRAPAGVASPAPIRPPETERPDRASASRPTGRAGRARQHSAPPCRRATGRAARGSAPAAACGRRARTAATGNSERAVAHEQPQHSVSPTPTGPAAWNQTAIDAHQAQREDAERGTVAPVRGIQLAGGGGVAPNRASRGADPAGDGAPEKQHAADRE